VAERVVFFPAGGWGNGSARTRLYYYLEALAAAGVNYHIASYTYHRYDGARSPSKLWLELLPLRNALAVLRADVLWFQKFALPGWAIRVAKLLGKRVVYDLDDALYLPHPTESASAVRDREKLLRILRCADQVVVSGPEIAEFVRPVNASVEIIPTVVERLAESPSSPLAPAVIGWVGAPENLRYLMRLEGAIQSLQSERPELEVWIVTSRPADPRPRFRYRFVPWSRDVETALVPQFTVGLAPLDDDPWCRAKMNYKAMVYMSHGVPAIVSPVGFPVEDFRHGESIWYARDEDEWMNALREALDDRGKRDAVAREALRVLAGKYTVAARAERWLTTLLGRRVMM
jgi:glycosyltransferase involved in cell wall biosynthesis